MAPQWVSRDLQEELAVQRSPSASLKAAKLRFIASFPRNLSPRKRGAGIDSHRKIESLPSMVPAGACARAGAAGPDCGDDTGLSANAPPPGFFAKAPGRLFPFSIPQMGNGVPGGARVLGAAPLAGMALPAARLRRSPVTQTCRFRGAPAQCRRAPRLPALHRGTLLAPVLARQTRPRDDHDSERTIGL